MATTDDGWKPIEGFPSYRVDEFGFVMNFKARRLMQERYACRGMGPGYNLKDEEGNNHYVETSELLRKHFPKE